MILCCQCGVEIEPNNQNICERCYGNRIGNKLRIITSMVIETCRGCERYHVPPRSWRSYEFGSKELLLFLLERNRSLKKINIIDSSFGNFEPTSKKILVEVIGLVDFMEQRVCIEYSIRNKQCTDCMRAESKQYWKACVQVRQKPHHRRTFIHLEQLIRSHRAHLKANNIKERKEGIDFFFSERGEAVKFVNFLRKFYGTKVTGSNELISEDRHNNTANKKFTFSVELVPFCKDDLVLSTYRPFGSESLLLVTKAASKIIFIDTRTNKMHSMNVKDFFSHEKDFRILMRSDQFLHYRVVYSRERKDGIFEATVTHDEKVYEEIVTPIRIKDEDVICCYDIKNSNLPLPEGVFCDILACRVFKDEIQRTIGNRLLTNEYNYFIQDNYKNKELLAGLTIYNPKSELVEEIINFKL